MIYFNNFQLSSSKYSISSQYTKLQSEDRYSPFKFWVNWNESVNYVTIFSKKFHCSNEVTDKLTTEKFKNERKNDITYLHFHFRTNSE